jgi:hypothetical protein
VTERRGQPGGANGRERDEPEPGVEGGTGPGVTPGDVETPGAATTPNLPDREETGDGEDDAER